MSGAVVRLRKYEGEAIVMNLLLDLFTFNLFTVNCVRKKKHGSFYVLQDRVEFRAWIM